MVSYLKETMKGNRNHRELNYQIKFYNTKHTDKLYYKGKIQTDKTLSHIPQALSIPACSGSSGILSFYRKKEIGVRQGKGFRTLKTAVDNVF